FVDVPTEGAHRHGDRVFVLDHDRIYAVEIESAERWYQRKLAANEAARGPVANSFSGGSLGFSFAIWKAGDPLCCPTGGRVVGTYKIIRENTPSAANYGMYVPGYRMLRKSLPPPGVASVSWKMAVDTAEREPLSGASYPQ
ncbi:MAG TPA: hypothetical protein VLL57_01270, partial [Candidatus Binataceae bacterium]|nr:hypothetical protein [Candidatus Binataceae bacterium]